jgi:hypothetical protein
MNPYPKWSLCGASLGFQLLTPVVFYYNNAQPSIMFLILPLIVIQDPIQATPFSSISPFDYSPSPVSSKMVGFP